MLGAPTMTFGVVTWVLYPFSPFLAYVIGLGAFVLAAWLVTREIDPQSGN